MSGRGLCDELITRPEESYRLWCVVVCDLETSRICAPYTYDNSSLRVNSSGRPDAWDFWAPLTLLQSDVYLRLQTLGFALLNTYH